MSYLLDKKAKQKRAAMAVIALFVFVLLFYFRSAIFSALSAGAGTIFNPVISWGGNVGNNISGARAFFASKDSLQRENGELRADLDQANAKMQNYNTVLEENNDLKEMLGRGAGERNLVLSAILGKPIQSIFGTLIIDASRVRVGDTVFAFGDLPIGRIAETGPSSSKVRLFSTSGEKIEVVMDGAYFELLGRGGGNFEMVAPRDLIFEKGQEAVLPGIRPYVVARVEAVISDPRDSFQKVLLVSPVNVEEIKFVQVELE